MEQTDIINTVSHHNKPIQTDVYIEACIFIGVKTACTENIGVRSTAGHNFNPADLFAYTAALSAAYQTAHVYFKTGFNEREKTCSHSDGDISAEHFGENAFNKHFARSKCKFFVNNECFILEESPFMSCVGRFVSVNSAGIYKAVRRFMCLEITHTSARQMRT